jgi:hypothetical protein
MATEQLTPARASERGSSTAAQDRTIVNSKTIETLVQKSDRVVTLADAMAKDAGYNGVDAITDDQRITLGAAVQELVDSFELVGRETEAAVVKARHFIDVPVGSTLVQQLDVLKAKVKKAADHARKAKEREADKKFRSEGV